ncbi:MAG: hypothetical protein ACK5LX_03295, partial [Oscillospiraceae bacterium]
FAWLQNFFLFKLVGNPVFAHTINAQLVDIPHHCRRVLVYNPPLRIFGVFDVAVGRQGERNTGRAAKPLGTANFAGNIAGIPLIEELFLRNVLRKSRKVA